MYKKLGLILIITSIVYVLAVVIGGALRENYSHLYNAISELTEAGTEKIFIIDLLFKVYNFLLLLYGGLMIIVYRGKSNKKMITMYLMLFLCGLSGFMMGIFPQEARDAQLTITGIMHFVGAGIAALSTMIITVLAFVNYRKSFKKYAIYSIITFIIIFISGISNVVLINSGIDSFFGLVERITIGSFIIWLFTTGLLQYRKKLC